FFSSRRRHTRWPRDWSSDVCSSDLNRFLDEFVALLTRDASKEELLSCAKVMLDSFAEEDTEEREQADTYVGEVMRAIGLDDWTRSEERRVGKECRTMRGQEQ